MTKKANISLIGFMGCGKTTIGKALSDYYNMSFLDTDSAIESICMLSIQQMFSIYGEPYFRNMEKYICKNIININNFVISTGGGICLCDENMKNLKNISTIIYIKKSVYTIHKHIKNDAKRPLYSPNINKLKDLFLDREHLYKKYADICIDIDNLSIFHSVNKIKLFLDKEGIYENSYNKRC